MLYATSRNVTFYTKVWLMSFIHSSIVLMGVISDHTGSDSVRMKLTLSCVSQN